MRIDTSLYYNERNEIILSKNYPGMSFDISETDPLIDMIRDLDIVCISVYAEEALTYEGEMGEW